MSKSEITHALLIELAKYGDVSTHSNGSSGTDWQVYWCDICKKEKAHRDNPDSDPIGCMVLLKEMIGDTTNRWRTIPNRGYEGYLVCLDFVGESEPYRCDKTIDMFPEEGTA